MLPLALQGIITSLIAAKLPKVAEAVMDKGVDYVQEKLGVPIKADMTPEEVGTLRIAALQHEEFRIDRAAELANTETQEVTKRHNADMTSDSWLSKNIRPLSLVAVLLMYVVFALLDAATSIDVKEAYIKLLGEWGMLIMSFYFGSRGLEKVFAIINSRSKKD